MKGFLLDTHVWLWLITDPARVSADLLDELRPTSVDLFLSAASCWELAIKHALGKISLPSKPSHFVPHHLAASGVTGLAIRSSHALRVSELPHHHRDPVDRLLVAQAQLEDLCLVTADSAIGDYDVAVRQV